MPWQKLICRVVGQSASPKPVRNNICLFEGRKQRPNIKAEFMAGNMYGCQDIKKVWNQHSSTHDVTTGANSDVIIIHSEDGPFIHLLCPNGLHLIGPASVSCLKTGQWSDTTKPYCSSVTQNDVPQSTLLLIGILAGCAALVLISVAVIIVSIVCMKRKNQRHSRSSTDYLRQSMESISSTTYHVDVNNANKIASAAVNSPKDRTGPTESDINVFPNRAFQPKETREYDQPWGHKPPVVDPPQNGTGLFPLLSNAKEYRTPF